MKIFGKTFNVSAKVSLACFDLRNKSLSSWRLSLTYDEDIIHFWNVFLCRSRWPRKLQCISRKQFSRVNPNGLSTRNSSTRQAKESAVQFRRAFLISLLILE